MNGRRPLGRRPPPSQTESARDCRQLTQTPSHVQLLRQKGRSDRPPRAVRVGDRRCACPLGGGRGCSRLGPRLLSKSRSGGERPRSTQIAARGEGRQKPATSAADHRQAKPQHGPALGLFHLQLQGQGRALRMRPRYRSLPRLSKPRRIRADRRTEADFRRARLSGQRRPGSPREGEAVVFGQDQGAPSSHPQTTETAEVVHVPPACQPLHGRLRGGCWPTARAWNPHLSGEDQDPERLAQQAGDMALDDPHKGSA